VYIKIIASCKGGTFFETQCISKQKCTISSEILNFKIFEIADRPHRVSQVHNE